MIETIEDAQTIIFPELQARGIKINRIKKTTSDQSIYTYTNKGVIRISDHHNEKSFAKCVASIVVPINEKIAIKMIQLL